VDRYDVHASDGDGNFPLIFEGKRERDEEERKRRGKKKQEGKGEL